MTHAVTLVTGGSRGIGRAVVQRLADAGHSVITLSRRDPAPGLPAHSYLVDLSDEAATAQALSDIAADYEIDNLVNNAADIAVGALGDITTTDLRRLTEVNLRAVVQCIQAVAPQMAARRRGRIVNLASRAALGKATRSIYSMTKAGLIGLSRSLALELAPDGITVNVVSPGPVETALFRANSPPGDPAVEALVTAIPAGRIGRPEDVAAAVAFFLTDEAAFITGQNLYVCGGLSIGAAALP